MAHSRARASCRLCGSSSIELALPLTPTPPADHYITGRELDREQEIFPVDVMLCRDCGNAQLSVVVDPRFLYGQYIYETTTSPGLVEHFARYAAEVVQRVGRRDGALAVDIGSNDGTLLLRFKEMGMRVLGIEPAAEVAEKARAAGADTTTGFLDVELARELRAQYGRAHLVTANNVFANIDDLDEVMEAVDQLLAEDGTFVIETFYFADLVRNMVWDFIYHEHLTYFTVTPLVGFFARHGMSLVAVDRVATKGGSMRCFVQRAKKAVVSASVPRFVVEEEAYGINRHERLVAFLREIDRRCTRLREILASARGDGRTIDGYGASPTTTALIYHSRVGGFLRRLIDDNPIKQGRYSPGLHIPVAAADRLYDEPPDDVLMIAWRFAPEIIAKHARFRERGGRFIIPLPEALVV